MATENHKAHYLVLDAARGIAALAVVIFHVQKYIYPNIVIPQVPNLFARSFLAVDLFFLMSGLVIARSYEAKLLTNAMPLQRFVATRFVRLWPLYILGTVLGYLYAIAKAKLLGAEAFEFWPNLQALMANSFFLPNLAHSLPEIFPYDPAAWSLAFEWAINLIYAAWAIRQNTRRLSVSAMLFAIGLATCAISYGSLDMGWGASTALGGALRISFSFTLGIIIYRKQSDGRLAVPSINPAILLALLAAALVTPLGCQTVYYDFLCDFLIFPAFVIFACRARTPALLKRPFSELGRMSYAIYILHNPLMSWFGGAWKAATHTRLDVMPALSGPLLLGTIILGSFLATRFFDEPVRNLYGNWRGTRLANRPAC